MDLFQLRVMMFIDNHFGLKDLIASQSQIVFPVDPDKPYTPIAIQDICRASGSVLQNLDQHKDKTYHLASDRFTLGDLAKVSVFILFSVLSNEVDISAAIDINVC